MAATHRHALTVRSENQNIAGKRPAAVKLDLAPSAAIADRIYPILRTFRGSKNIDVDRELATSSSAIRRGMLNAEVNSKAAALPDDYVKVRGDMVDLVLNACDRCGPFKDRGLESTTAHVAVGYMDKVAINFWADPQRRLVIPASCIMLAAKWEEKAYEKDYETLPDVRGLADFILRWHGYWLNADHPDMVATEALIRPMEMAIVQAMDWRMTMVTPLHYLGLHSRCGMLFSNDATLLADLADDNHKRQLVRRLVVDVKPKDREQILQNMDEHAVFFAEMCLKHAEFYSVPPSAMAAGIVLATRRINNIQPMWNPSLEPVLGVCGATAMSVLDRIWAVYKVEQAALADNCESMELEAAANERAVRGEIEMCDREGADELKGESDQRGAGAIESPHRMPPNVQTLLSSPLTGQGMDSGMAGTPASEASTLTASHMSSGSAATAVTQGELSGSFYGMHGSMGDSNGHLEWIGVGGGERVQISRSDECTDEPVSAGHDIYRGWHTTGRSSASGAGMGGDAELQAALFGGVGQNQPTRHNLDDRGRFR